MSDRALRWGILSTARINDAIIPALARSPGNELVAVASRDRAVASAFADRWHIPTAYGSYDELLAADVDVVYNPLPNHLHVPLTLAAIQAGKHVLCEKPLALHAEEVDEVAAAAASAGVVVTEAFMYRHHPQTLRVVELVASGAVGTPQTVRGSFSFPLERVDDIRLDPLLGGGCLWDVGCYPLSYARTVLGEEPVEVAGWQRVGPTGVDVSFWGTLRFASGVVAQFDSGFISPYRPQMEIVGEDGLIVIPHPFKPTDDDAFLMGASLDELHEVRMTGGDLYRDEVEDLAEAITTGRAPRVPLADTRANVEVIVALLRSAEEGQPLPL